MKLLLILMMAVTIKGPSGIEAEWYTVSSMEEHHELKEKMDRDYICINKYFSTKLLKNIQIPHLRHVLELSKIYNIDPVLVLAVIIQESNGKNSVRSHKGATGLMQLMPATARYLKVKNIHDPYDNIDGGIRYLLECKTSFANLDLVLAAYNAGIPRVKQYGRIPPFKETQNYVRKIKKHITTIKSDLKIIGLL